MHQDMRHSFPNETQEESDLSFRFSLTYEEALEAFLLIIDRRTPTARKCMSGILLLLAVLCVYLYGIQPYGLQFALMGLLFAFFSFLVYAQPSLKASRAARKVAAAGGTYALVLSEKGYFLLPGDEKLSLKGDSRSRAFETDTLFAIRPDRFHTVCLPKHALREPEAERVHKILKTNIRAFHDRRGSYR